MVDDRYAVSGTLLVGRPWFSPVTTVTSSRVTSFLIRPGAARQGTRDGERLDVLVTLIEAYERKHFPMES